MESFERPTSVLIAIPTVDYISQAFCDCLVKLVRYCDAAGIYINVRFQCGTIVHHGREELAKYAVEHRFTHVFWLDADMTFEPWILEKMLSADKDFVTGIYRSRHGEHVFMLFESNDPWKLRETIPLEGLFEVFGCGFGCVLLRTELLKESKDTFDTCFLPQEGLGEDLSFCRRMTILGRQMYAMPDIRLGHISHTVIEGW